MKKIIAAALSVLVGAFGYTIVDSTIENRVNSLESRVYMLQNEVSKYHPSHSAYTTSPNTESKTIISETPTYVPPSSSDSSFRVGKTIIAGTDSRTKFLIRIHENGYVEYISPEDYAPSEEIEVLRAAAAEATTGIELNDPRPTEAEQTTVTLGDPRETDLNDPRETTTIGYCSSAKPGDYFLCLNNVSAVVSAITEESMSFYNKDYSLVSQPIYNEFSFTITYSGQTDPELAGERIKFHTTLESLGSRAFCRLVDSSNNIVKNDGSFNFTETYKVQNYFLNDISWLTLLNNRLSYEIYSVELYSKL